MEKGYYSPSVGYWQTTGAPPPEILATYPADTVEVPLKPGANYEWQGGAWVYVAPPPEVPAQVPKLALVRAMRKTAMDGSPAAQGQSTIWDGVRAAIAMAGGATEEDWNLAVVIPRADPALNGLAAMLVPDGPTRTAILDALFILAEQIDRGEVAP